MLVKDTLRYFFIFPCLIVSEFSQLRNVGHFPLTFPGPLDPYGVRRYKLQDPERAVTFRRQFRREAVDSSGQLVLFH